MAEKKKRARTRAEAGIVEKDFTKQPESEAVAAGEHIDQDAVAEAVEDAAAMGAAHAAVIAHNPSEALNPYVSQEEQYMEMTPQVVGPPAYGSPDPLTSAGRLVPLEDHPLAEGRVPEGSAIAGDYGADVKGANLAAGELFAHPGGPQRSDLEIDSAGGREGREATQAQGDAYEDMTVAELNELAADREIAGRSQMNKEELVEALKAYDSAS